MKDRKHAHSRTRASENMQPLYMDSREADNPDHSTNVLMDSSMNSIPTNQAANNKTKYSVISMAKSWKPDEPWTMRSAMLR